MEEFRPSKSIDRLLHEPARTEIVSLLYVIDKADFLFVMNQTGLTWGNLSSHLTKLEEGGYVLIQKSFNGKKPNTTLQLTEQGRGAFKEYIQQMRNYYNQIPI